MSIVSHLYHLFNAETCQAYIHALRWKDRPLQCPRAAPDNSPFAPSISYFLHFKLPIERRP